jgi:hypothetical protein
MGWWHSDGLDAIESVNDNVLLARYVLYVGGQLGYEIEVVELPR